MSVPFRYKQSYRDLFEFLGNNKDITKDVLDKFASLLEPLFPETSVTKYLEMCPIGVDKFMLFIADGQAQISINFDVILWNYVAKMAQYNLFKGEQQCALKELRSSVDPSLKVHCKEPDLTNLYKKHCSAFAKGGDAATVNITHKELAEMWKELSANTPLSDLLRALMPKMRGGKSTAVSPPPRGAGSPSSGSPASPSSPKSPMPNKLPTTAANPEAAALPQAAVPLKEETKASQVAITPARAVGGSAKIQAPSTPPPEPEVEEIPPPPASEDPASPKDDSPVSAESNNIHLRQPLLGRSGSALTLSRRDSSVGDILNDSKEQQADQQQHVHTTSTSLGGFRRPSKIEATTTGVGHLSPLSDRRSPTNEMGRSISPTDTGRTSPGTAKPTVDASTAHGSYTQKMLELLARGGAMDGGLVNAQGSVIDTPALPLEVIEFLGGLEKQRCELQEQLQREIDEIHDCNSAISSMKSRRDKLMEANAAYFALRGANEDGADLVTGKDISLRITNPNAPPVPRGESSPFIRIANDRQELLTKMEIWLAKARDENDFLRKEVALARQAMHYDETSAVVGDLIRMRSTDNTHHHSSPSPRRQQQSSRGHSSPTKQHRHNHRTPAPQEASYDSQDDDEEGDSDLPLPPADIMHSPYRVARFYSNMAKKDKELQEKAELLKRMHHIDPPYPQHNQQQQMAYHPQYQQQAEEEAGYQYRGQVVPEHLFYRHYYDEVPELGGSAPNAPTHQGGRQRKAEPQQQHKPSAAAKYWASTTASLAPVQQSIDRQSDMKGSSFVQRRPPQQYADPSAYHQQRIRQPPHVSNNGTPAITKGLESYFTSQQQRGGGY